MVATPSTMLPLGTPLPEFALPDAVDGRTLTSGDFADRSALLVMFICNHCPFVKHVLYELTRLGADYLPKGVGVVAIRIGISIGRPKVELPEWTVQGT